MRLKRFFWIAPTTVLLIISQTFRLNFPVPLAVSPVVAQTSDARKAEAERLLQQGLQQHQASQFQAAIQSWQQALTIYREIRDRQGEGKVLGYLGLAYLDLGDYAKVIAYSNQYLAIVREIKDRQGEGVALGNLSLAYLNLRNYTKGIDYSQQVLAIAREFHDRQSEGKALWSLGIAYLNLGDYAKAIKYSQQWLVIAREIKNHQSEGKALENLGVAYLNLGDYAKAIESFQQWLAIAREIKNRQSEEWALVNLGIAYDELGDYAKVVESFQQVLAIARETKNRQSEGRALGSLSLAYSKLRDYTKAIEYSQQWLVITREIKDRQSEGRALGNLGYAYLTLREYAKAIDYLQQRLIIAREIDDRQAESQALGELGSAYLYLGDYVKAIDYSEQLLRTAREIKDRQGEGIALGDLGIAYFYLGDYAKALEYHQQHLAIAREMKDPQNEGNALANLGVVYDRLGDYAKAIEYHQQHLAIARQIPDPQSEGDALGNLGIAYFYLGDYAKAIEYQKQHLAIALQIKDPKSEGNALNNLGLALYKSGNLPTAEKTLLEGIKVLESLRGGLDDSKKLSIFDVQRGIYNTLQQVLIAQNKTDTALEIAERGRARVFVELLSSRLSSNLKSEEKPPIPTVEEIKQIAKAQNATLIQYSIIPDEFKVEGRLQPQESELYIWVISPNGKVTFRSVDLKSLRTTVGGSSLRKLVAETLESLGVGEDRNGIFEVTAINSAADPQRQTKSLKQLHQLLIQPIADLLPTDPNSRIIFVPHQDLFRVPFPALIDSDGKYLVEKHTILTAPSIQVLELTHQQRQKVSRSGQGALVVGNPSPMPTGFLPLKGAEKEANDVAQLLKTKPLIGSQATEPAVLQQLSNARIIHLATHGTFNEQQPLLGGVALAQTGKDTQNDGLLTAEEIFNLKRKLSAELLVLSACNTGRGRITGDGVIGLSRSFIAAGIPSVIVSLWSVPDAPTAELMTEFYTNLYQKKLDKAQALRMAMLKIMEKYRDNPRAWAAFTLIGEAE